MIRKTSDDVPEASFDRLDECVRGFAIDAVAVLVHVVAVPVLDVRADLQGIGTGGRLARERDVERVVVGAGDRGDGYPADAAARPGERDLRRGEGRGIDLFVEGQLDAGEARAPAIAPLGVDETT